MLPNLFSFSFLMITVFHTMYSNYCFLLQTLLSLPSCPTNQQPNSIPSFSLSRKQAGKQQSKQTRIFKKRIKKNSKEKAQETYTQKTHTNTKSEIVAYKQKVSKTPKNVQTKQYEAKMLSNIKMIHHGETMQGLKKAVVVFSKSSLQS